MKLFISPGACSLASHIVLQDSGLKFTTETVNWESGQINAITSKGYVPALEMDNGQILTEGAAILQFIADQAPSKNLIPANGTLERYRAQEWLNYISTEVHKGFSPLFNDKNSTEVKAAALTELEKKFEYLSTELKGKTFLMGNQFTVCDAYLFTVLNWTHFLKVDLTKWPVLLGFMESVKNRPGTMAALKAEKLI